MELFWALDTSQAGQTFASGIILTNFCAVGQNVKSQWGLVNREECMLLVYSSGWFKANSSSWTGAPTEDISSL